MKKDYLNGSKTYQITLHLVAQIAIVKKSIQGNNEKECIIDFTEVPRQISLDFNGGQGFD